MNAIFKCNHCFKILQYNCRYPSYALIYTLKTCFQLHMNIPPLQAFWGLQTKVGKTFQEVNSKIPVWLHLYIWTVTISWQNRWSPSYSFLNHLRLDSAKPSSTSLSRHLLKKQHRKQENYSNAFPTCNTSVYHAIMFYGTNHF